MAAEVREKSHSVVIMLFKFSCPFAPHRLKRHEKRGRKSLHRRASRRRHVHSARHPRSLATRHLRCSCDTFRWVILARKAPFDGNLISLITDAEHHIGREELDNRVPAAHRSADVLHEEVGIVDSRPHRWYKVLEQADRQHRWEWNGHGGIIWVVDGPARCASARSVSSNRLSKQKKGEVQEKTRWVFKWQRNYLRLR